MEPLFGFEEKVFSVGLYLELINTVLKSEKAFVVGEVSEWKVYPSGIYFSIKDKEDGSVLRCYMHPSIFRQAGISVEVGMDVKLEGSPAIYKPTGQFNFRATSIELVGEGALKKAYERLLKKLGAEGLFSRKRELPERIEKIGIISSRGGVVIQDFRKNLLPLGFKLYFADSRVEGAQAVPELIRAVRRFNAQMPDLDVIVVIRGGGSLESMQAFNNEAVCRQFFSSRIPVVAGIGHDVDVPIATMVADATVSTPTAAAHLMNRSWDGFRNSVETLERSILTSFAGALKETEIRVERSIGGMFRGLRHIFVLFKDMEKRFMRGAFSVGDRIAFLKTRTGSVLGRAMDRVEYSIQSLSAVLEKKEQLLRLSDPARNLRLGYSIVFDGAGRVVKSARSLAPGESIRSTFAEGEVISEITEVVVTK